MSPTSRRSCICLLAVLLGLVAGLDALWADGAPPAAPDAMIAVPEGLDLPNAKMPAPGLVVGGQPSAEHLKRAAELGIAWVVDLRGVGELEGRDEKAEVEALGMRYVSIPIAGKEALDRAAAERLAETLEEAASGSESSDGPRVLVHCASGNRVGGLFALKAFFVDGEDADTALALGDAFGMRASLRPAVEELLAPAAGHK